MTSDQPELDRNLYFELSTPRTISNVEELLSLNVERTYYQPGDQTPIPDRTSEGIYNPLTLGHTTAGIFRGQIQDWPLVPKCFRNAKIGNEITDVVRSFRWLQATSQFQAFCDRAEQQNPQFPAGLADRMSIAQHFGVPTPLLDWSRSIFTAVFFAIRDIFADESFPDRGSVFIYHVIDERLLSARLPEQDLSLFGLSAFVKPYHIDRRIERQRGVFTYHPYPGHRPPKVTARVYVLDGHLVLRLLELMKGFGFTEDYFFPDYAGISGAVTSNTSL